MTDQDATEGTGITFLRSTTTTRTDREADGDTTTLVEHLARFAIKLGAVSDMLAEYSETSRIRPSWLEVKWDDGRLNRVYVSGPRTEVNGGVSEKLSGHRQWHKHYQTEAFDRSELPGPIAEAVAAYEVAVAVESGVTR